MLCHARYKAQLAGLAQRLGAQAALRPDNDVGRVAHRACRAGRGHHATKPDRAARQRHVAAVHSGLAIGNDKPVFRKPQYAAGTLQAGRAGCNLNIVASERDAALNARFFKCAKRQFQFQAQIAAAAAAGLRQRLAGHLADGRTIDDGQNGRQGTAPLRIDRHGGVQKVRDFGVRRSDLQPRRAAAAVSSGAHSPNGTRTRNSRRGHPACSAFDLQAQAVKQKLTRQLCQLWPGQRTGRCDAARHIRQHYVGHRGRYAEVPLRCICKGQVMQVALDLELHIAASASYQRIPHVITHLGKHHLGQVAVHAWALHAAHSALQVKHARETAAAPRSVCHAGFPFKLGVTLRIGIAELDVAALKSQPVALNLPLHVTRQLRQRDQRVIKKIRQFNRAVGHGDSRFTALLVQIKINCGTAKSG